MFGNCCGCSKEQNSNGKEKPVVINEKVTNSDTNVIKNLNDNVLELKKSEIDNSNRLSSLDRIVNNIDLEESFSSAKETPLIVEQPRNPLDIKRQSTISDPKIEDDENDDVFCEGLAPPMKLADNLGTPYPDKKEQTHIPLPRWFSEDDDQEVGGIQEPPATPVGRDELALRRHRLFADLMTVAQCATQHKVRFDPLGPTVAGVDDQDCCQSFNDLELLVNRLEIVTDRLETICVPVQELLEKSYICTAPSVREHSSDSVIEIRKSNMSVAGFRDIVEGPFASYLAVSQQIGGDVAAHSILVERAFQTQLKYMILASQSAAPAQPELVVLLHPTSETINAIQQFREMHRTSPYFNHLSAISESIPALGWVTIVPAPAPYIKEMNDAGQFYTNRVLKDWKEKDKKHIEWVRTWIQTLGDLQAFVKQFHTTGLVWAGRNPPIVGAGVPPPPPPGCPPPPLTFLEDVAAMDTGNDRSALFAQINQGENITKSLKRVTDDMQTHKNPTLRTGPAPFKSTSGSFGSVSVPALDKSPVFTKDGKKWIIEYQTGNKNLVVENAEMNNVVYLFKCVDSSVVVKGKINSITLDSCKKTSLVFESVVASVEFINCQSVQMQVLGKVPTISVDKTDGCQMYLSSDSLNVEVISSKSSEMNILVPKPNGDYMEFPVPEQYKTTVNPSGLTTIAIETKG